MKKIMLTAVWTVESKFHKTQNLVNRNHFDIYKELNNLSVSTFKKHHPDWEHETILINEPFKNHHLAFFKVFKETYKIWKENKDSTILFHDVDSICHKNLDHIIKKFNSFMCFGVHDSKDIQKPKKDRGTYFSCSLRLFPKEMKEEIWELGFKLWEEYFKNPNDYMWAIEQEIYNEMLFKNKKLLSYEEWFNINDVRSFLRNEYNTDSHVYQFHGTRNIENTLRQMRELVLDELEKE